MDRVEKNSGYWSELMADSGRYLKFYNIKGNDYGSVPVRIKEDSVLAHVSETNSSLFDFYGSVFALYLSRIDLQRKVNSPEGRRCSGFLWIGRAASRISFGPLKQRIRRLWSIRMLM